MATVGPSGTPAPWSASMTREGLVLAAGLFGVAGRHLTRESPGSAHVTDRHALIESDSDEGDTRSMAGVLEVVESLVELASGISDLCCRDSRNHVDSVLETASCAAVCGFVRSQRFT